MLVSQYAGSDTFKNLEETMHVQVGDLSQDSTFDLFEFLPNFFPKFKFPNSGCGLSASAAYTPVFTVAKMNNQMWHFCIHQTSFNNIFLAKEV